MKRSLFVLTLLCVCCLASPAFVTSAQGPCTGIATMTDCPDVGCGVGDGKLNAMKNRTDDTPPNIQSRLLSQIRALAQPSSWVRNKDRSPLARRENRGVVVKAYLLDARISAKETTNCKLNGPDNKDIHLDLVSSPGAAKSTTVAAEITPRLRKEGWDFEKLDYLGQEKYYVRITGWFLLDTMHISNPLERATNWEIHPVTKFEVCTLTKKKCNQGVGWVKLEDWELEE